MQVGYLSSIHNEIQIMKTIDIERHLFKYFKFTSNVVVLNITPLSTLVKFETDLISLTPARYATGVEIKVSLSDLKNDLKKRQYRCKDCMRYYNRFKYFYYVVPSTLVKDTIELVHPWIGVLEVGPKGGVRTRKKARKLHGPKWSVKDERHLLHLGCMRQFKYLK